MSNRKRIVLWLMRLPSWWAAAALFVLMILTFVDVLLRSVVNAPIEAATELTRIAMAFVVFASLPAISYQGRHINVDLLDPWFSRSWRRVRDTVVDVSCALLLVWPGTRCLELAARARNNGDLTEYLNIPTFYIAYFVAIAVLLTSLTLIARAVMTVLARAPEREASI